MHTHHADETLVSVSSQYLPLQLSDSSLQSLHGGGRRLLLRDSDGEEGEMLSLDIVTDNVSGQHPDYELLVLSSSSPRLLTVPPSFYVPPFLRPCP